MQLFEYLKRSCRNIVYEFRLKNGCFVTFTWRNLQNDEKPRKWDIRFKNPLSSIRKFSVQTRLTKSELATTTDRWSIEIGFENLDIMQT